MGAGGKVLSGSQIMKMKLEVIIMRAKHKTGLLLALVMMCILCFSVVPVWAEPQGTDGTELQVAQPEQLEIGGSKSYVLTCMNSAAKTPSPSQAPATTESQPAG